MKVSFEIPLEPFAQERVGTGIRWIGNSPRVYHYDKRLSRIWKERVMLCASTALHRNGIKGLAFDEKTPLQMTVIFFRTIPPSWSKKKQQAALSGDLWPVSRPDLSNYLKGLEDALNGIVYPDDSAICRSTQLKGYAKRAHTRVIIEELDTEALKRKLFATEVSNG